MRGGSFRGGSFGGRSFGSFRGPMPFAPMAAPPPKCDCKKILTQLCTIAAALAGILLLLSFTGVIGPIIPPGLIDGLFPKKTSTTNPPSSTDAPPPPKATAAFVGVDGLCLDVPDNGEWDGNPIQGYHCNPLAPGPSQRWFMNDRQIIHKAQDGKQLCLDLKDNDHSNGTPLQLWTCSNSESQQWRVESSVIKTEDGKKCVSLESADPSNVYVSDCVPNTSSQKWKVEGLPDVFIA